MTGPQEHEQFLDEHTYLSREFVPAVDAESSDESWRERVSANGGQVLSVYATPDREAQGFGPQSPAGRPVLGRDLEL